jgi:hypothetical protein
MFIDELEKTKSNSLIFQTVQLIIANINMRKANDKNAISLREVVDVTSADTEEQAPKEGIVCNLPARQQKCWCW